MNWNILNWSPPVLVSMTVVCCKSDVWHCLHLWLKNDKRYENSMNCMWHGTDLNPTRIPPCPVSCGFQGSSRGSKRRRPHGWAMMSRCGLPCNSMRTASMSSKLRSESEMIWHHWNLVLKCFEQTDIQRKRKSIHNTSLPWENSRPAVRVFPRMTTSRDCDRTRVLPGTESQRWVVIQTANLKHPWAPNFDKICVPESIILPYFHIFCFGKWKWHVVACSCCVSVVRWPTMTNINAGPHLWHDRHWHQLPKTETSPRNVQRWSSFYSPSCFWDLLRSSEILYDDFMTTVLILMFNNLINSCNMSEMFHGILAPWIYQDTLWWTPKTSGKTDWNTEIQCREHLRLQHDKAWQLHNSGMKQDIA